MRPTLFAFAAILAVAQAAHADQEVYSIKQSAPSAGSRIRKAIVVGYTPLDKRYAELTPEQQTFIKADYEKMAPGDEPPFPEAGLLPLYKAVAVEHEKLDLAYKGPLLMRVDVDANGHATKIDVLDSPDDEIKAVAYNAIVDQTFKPGLCSGKPCAGHFLFRAELVGPDWKNSGDTAIHVKHMGLDG